MNDSQPDTTAEATAAGEYQVLARKYRPKTFKELIGQDAMVRTLSNAFAQNRVHHAFVMTGVRGVGKTSTARIIARALNCIGPDGKGGPTTEPCGECEHCVAIAADRHVDVLEMDAASNNSVDNIRELIDGVRYRPASARYKVYIIDEVHMLSKAAFNALLKTLEEPPEHVIFIFATTEIRRVPITVLSRCQRFDLRRVPAETLAEHFAGIAKKEGAEITEGALHLLARAADGSVRDGLSLLDQAIAHAEGTVDDVRVRDMLGLADRARTFDLLEAVLKGDIEKALNEFAAQYKDGADPISVIEDMLDLVHWLTRVKVMPTSLDAPEVPEQERTKGGEIASALRMPILTRAWQLLLKGLEEVRYAPAPAAAAEMVLVRLAYAADLPTPGDAVKALQEGADIPAGNPAPGSSGGSGGGARAAVMGVGSGGAEARGRPMEQQSPAPAQSPPVPQARAFPDLAAVAALAEELREGLLAAFLVNQVRPVRFEPGTLEFAAEGNVGRDMVQKLKGFLEEHTGMPWSVALARESSAETIADKRAQARQAARNDAAGHPLVKAVLDAFPGATVEDVRKIARAPSVADAPEAVVDPDEVPDDLPDV